jgi:hypothetical protein
VHPSRRQVHHWCGVADGDMLHVSRFAVHESDIRPGVPIVNGSSHHDVIPVPIRAAKLPPLTECQYYPLLRRV